MSDTPVAAGQLSAEERSKSSGHPVIEISAAVMEDMAAVVDADVWFEGKKVLAMTFQPHEALTIAESIIRAATVASHVNRGQRTGSLQ